MCQVMYTARFICLRKTILISFKFCVQKLLVRTLLIFVLFLITYTLPTHHLSNLCYLWAPQLQSQTLNISDRFSDFHLSIFSLCFKLSLMNSFPRLPFCFRILFLNFVFQFPIFPQFLLNNTIINIISPS